MIGFYFHSQNTLWAPKKSFNKHHINIRLPYSTQHLSQMKEMCTNHLQNKDDHKHDKESDPGPN